MNTNPIIKIDNLFLNLKGPSGEVSILGNINLLVNAGEKISIIGPSGSGKTSLLLVIAGLEHASKGSIEVNGRLITKLSEDALAIFRRDNIGIVFQNFHLIPTMTALENVALPLEFSKNAEPFKIAADTLESVGLSHRLQHLPSQLSGGEQQRVALARAFVMRPKILLADEPTGNLDQENGKQIVELIFKMHQQYGTTLVLITHDQNLARSCDRVISLRDGNMVD